MTTRERLKELPVGSPIPFDIIGRDGSIYLREGAILSQPDIDYILSRGLIGISDRGVGAEQEQKNAGRKDVSAAWVKHYYGESTFARFDRRVREAKDALGKITEAAASQRAFHTHPLQEIVGEVIGDVMEDSSAVLAFLSGLSEQVFSEKSESRLHHSVQLSTLATVIASSMDLTTKDCRAVGLAGMLHDLSLFDPLQETDHIWNHPTRTVDLLASSPSIPSIVRVIIGQVHEHPDGTGYPRRLKNHQLNPLTGILSLADAYLNLLQPRTNRSPLVHADALAYLVYQTLNGKFDRNCMLAFMASTSMYPIGSSVILDDKRIATVVRNNDNEFCSPVVIVNSPPFQVIDLRDESVRILKPFQDSQSKRIRLPTSRLSEVLWKDPDLIDPTVANED